MNLPLGAIFNQGKRSKKEEQMKVGRGVHKW